VPSRTTTLTTPDGRTLAVYEGGALAGAPIFYLHGSPGAGLLFDPHVTLAERQGVRLIGYDRPGYGGSTPQPGRSVGDVAGDVAAIAEALELDRLAVWGVSGGGPHALACAALPPDGLVAAASLASPVPYDAEGVDWMAGMGELNIEEFRAALAGRETLEPLLEAEARTFRTLDPQGLIEAWRTILSPADEAVLSGELAAWIIETLKLGAGQRVDGWVDDDLAFVKPWGFELSDIQVPLQLWQGRHDAFVPPWHGEWLAEHVPSVDAHLSDDDGHLTLLVNRVADVHAWLLAHF
jgi:pimeloyl-ACP methyl ester carboxylesterase